MAKRTLIAAVLLVCALVRAEEWDRFRGPNGCGIGEAANVPASFTSANYNWKIALPGGGHSSPVAWGDRIFITCSDRETATRMVLGINAANGKIVWRREFASHAYHENPDNDYASSTPAVDEKHVYVCWSTPEEFSLICLDHDGKDVWKTSLGRYASQHGSGTSPIVVGDLVLVDNDQEGPHSSLIGIDRNTGRKVWEHDRTAGKQGGMSASTPALFKDGDGTESAVFCSRYSGITGVNPKTGEVVWEMKDAFKNRTVGSPVVFGDKVLAFAGEGPRGHEFIVLAPSGNKATVAYELKDATPYVPTPLVIGDRLFTLSDVGVASWYVASSGKKIWQEKIGPAYFSSPVCASGKIYCISKRGDVTCLAAKDEFKSLGTSRLGELTHATPGIVEGKLIVRTFTHLISIGK